MWTVKRLKGVEGRPKISDKKPIKE